MRLTFFALLCFSLFVASCGNDDDDGGGVTPPPPPTGVNFEPAEVPYGNLSEYRFFSGDLADLTPNEGLVLYEPISTLFTDYAKKSRYIWLPEGTNMEYSTDADLLDFPDNSVIIKNFYYDNVQPDNSRRIIETRLLYKIAGEWKFADYIWNEDQTEATFDLSGSNTPVEFIDDNGISRIVNYRIPSDAECLTCHKKSDIPSPIGPKPQNLNAELQYPDGSRMNQLAKLNTLGYLAGQPDLTSITTVVKWNDPTQDLDLRVRSYLDMNCAHCHSDEGHCDYRSMRFAFEESTTDENLGVCVDPDDFIGGSLTKIITPGRTTKSVLHYRMNSNADMVRMPLIGRSVIHTEAVAMIEEWIDGMEGTCE